MEHYEKIEMFKFLVQFLGYDDIEEAANATNLVETILFSKTKLCQCKD